MNNFLFHDQEKSEPTVKFINNDVLDGLNLIKDKSIDLIISSPPYNIGKIYEKRDDFDKYLSWQKLVLSKCYEKLKDSGSIVWQVGNYIEDGEVFPLDIYLYSILKELNMKLRNRIVWHFDHGLHAKNRLSGRYETLLWFTKSSEYKFNLDPIRVPSKYPGKRHYKGDKKGLPSGNPLGKNPSDFWSLIKNEFDIGIIDIPNVKANHPEKTSHPCQFPVELIERFILGMTDEMDVVLDPFGGVGTTVIASYKNNRNSIYIDKEVEYIEIAKNRLELLKVGDLKTRPIGKPIHKPTGKEAVAQVPLEWLK